MVVFLFLLSSFTGFKRFAVERKNVVYFALGSQIDQKDVFFDI